MNQLQRQSRFDRSDDVVVMKFGGTSVEDAPAVQRLINIVQSRLDARPVVVVSALAGVTDQLLDAGHAAAGGRLGAALDKVREIYVRHEKLADELLQGSPHAGLENQLRSDFRAEFKSLEFLLHALDDCRKLNAQSWDHLLGFGECLSSKLVTAALAETAICATHVDARSCIITELCDGQALPLWDETNARVQTTLGPLLESGQVPVLGGFIASAADGTPTSLGRGGSDFTAAIIGASLSAARVEIWKTVDGVMTADPKVCPEARVIRKMSFAEAAELARCGAKVLHPETLAPLLRENIPVYVLNSCRPEDEGTEIAARARPGDSVRAITIKRSVVAVENAPQQLQSNGPADVYVNAKWESNSALVCVVGENIRQRSDVASLILEATSDLNVSFCQSESVRTISFLVEDSKAEESVRRLHGVFFPKPEIVRDWGGISAAFCQAGQVEPASGSVANLGRD
jgi:aspartate kinase